MTRFNAEKYFRSDIYNAAEEVLVKEPVIIGARYVPVFHRQGLVETFRWWLKTGDWERTRTEFKLVMPGEPGYDDAPYEMGYIYGPDLQEYQKQH